ncbi:MAG: hypothetical protein LBC87_11835 [Fibromonadaceae bacterium]|nr:hypothetical protein [Fibromonadaceae bacterium]
MREIDEEEYKSHFKTGLTSCPKDIHKEAYKIANENRKFEIDNYWKRANYYWLFQISVYTGYFYSITVQNDKYICKHPGFIIVGITCLGFLTALAWFFSNRGSKKWQENWESHVDSLENEITGPLYKTTSCKETWSVSRINEIVSGFSIVVWVLLGIETVCSFFSCTLLIIYLVAMCAIAGSFYFYGKGLKDRDKEIHWFKVGED